MAISEDLATDIDIVIAMWCQQRRVVGISWDDRCALRKLIYDLFVAENRRADTVEAGEQVKAAIELLRWVVTRVGNQTTTGEWHKWLSEADKFIADNGCYADVTCNAALGIKDLAATNSQQARLAICHNAQVKYIACRCLVDKRDCNGRGEWTHYAPLGLQYGHQCERYDRRQAGEPLGPTGQGG